MWWFFQSGVMVPAVASGQNPLPLHLAHLQWVLQALLSQLGCLSERIFTSEIYMYLHTVQLLATLLTLISKLKYPYICINILKDPFECMKVFRLLHKLYTRLNIYFSYFHRLFLNVYLSIYMYLCKHVCMYTHVYVCMYM